MICTWSYNLRFLRRSRGLEAAVLELTEVPSPPAASVASPEEAVPSTEDAAVDMPERPDEANVGAMGGAA